MEGIGRLAGGVAHDFNNVLTVIGGYLEMLRSEQLTANADRMLGRIKQAAERATALTQRLLAFSRNQMLQPVAIDPGKMIADMSDMIRRLVGEDVQVVLRSAENIWPVMIDPNQTEQVLFNLAANARDAMPDGGRLTISAENRTVKNADESPYHVPPGDYVFIEVADTGCGMSEETRARAFEPFFTTKGPEQGTGLGLAMAYGFITQSHGHIYIDSKVGRGTRFLIYLPRAVEPAGELRGKVTELTSMRGRETVLVIEDEEGVRMLLVDALKRAGYTVLAAERPDEARSISASQPGRIDLAIADVVMPQMSGPRLVEELLSEQPQMQVMYISGYADDEVIRRGVEQGAVEFLQKPFSLPVLLTRVRRVLDVRRA
jgi:two-component system cell cycle sensor histidine kinase/response regulator CckA